MLLLKDVGGGRFLRYCDIDMSFPESIRRRQKQLTELGLIKDHLARIDELRTVVAQYERDRDNLLGRNGYLENELERITLKYQHEVNVALGKPSNSELYLAVVDWKDQRGGCQGRKRRTHHRPLRFPYERGGEPLVAR